MMIDSQLRYPEDQKSRSKRFQRNKQLVVFRIRQFSRRKNKFILKVSYEKFSWSLILSFQTLSSSKTTNWWKEFIIERTMSRRFIWLRKGLTFESLYISKCFFQGQNEFSSWVMGQLDTLFFPFSSDFCLHYPYQFSYEEMKLRKPFQYWSSALTCDQLNVLSLPQPFIKSPHPHLAHRSCRFHLTHPIITKNIIRTGIIRNFLILEEGRAKILRGLCILELRQYDKNLPKNYLWFHEENHPTKVSFKVVRLYL